jgi:hypothetical protein
MSMTAPSRLAAYHDPHLLWVQPDIQLHVSFTVLLHGESPQRSNAMTVKERRSGLERRSGKDRRGGIDARSEEEKRRIGERRLGVDRRSGSDRRSRTEGQAPKQS